MGAYIHYVPLQLNLLIVCWVDITLNRIYSRQCIKLHNTYAQIYVCIIYIYCNEIFICVKYAAEIYYYMKTNKLCFDTSSVINYKLNINVYECVCVCVRARARVCTCHSPDINCRN